MMTLYKQRLFARLHRPAGDDGSDTGGTAVQDRGDSVLDTPEGDDEPEELADPFEEKGEKGKKGEKIEKSEADDAEDDEKKPKKDSRIPLSRHKDILAKERAQREMLEQRLAQYEKGQEVSRTNEELTALEDSILKMEKDYNRLLADGEVDKAAEMMTKIPPPSATSSRRRPKCAAWWRNPAPGSQLGTTSPSSASRRTTRC